MTVKSLADLDKDIQLAVNTVEETPQLETNNSTLEVQATEVVEESYSPSDALAEILQKQKQQNIDADAPKAKIEGLLSNLKIDVGNIRVVKSDNPLHVHNDINALFIRPTFEVIALQSGYRASFTSLNNNEIINARKINGTEYEQNLKLFKIIFDHISTTSIGKLKFEEFLKNTSENDFTTLVYGLYCATYPKESDYTVKCPKCKADNTAKVSKYSLIEVPNEETIKYVQSIISKNLPPEEALKYSILNIKEKFILEESKTLIEISTPSLYDTINSLSKPSKFRNIEAETFGYLKYITQIAIPNLAALSRGYLEFIEVDQDDQKLDVFIKLSSADKSQLEKMIADKINKYNVNYRLPDITCGSCATEIKKIDIDLLEMLFKNIVGA